MARTQVSVTEWGLQSYLELKGKGVFCRNEYKQTIRPDVDLLKDGIPPNNPSAKFNNSNFWGPMTDKGGSSIQHGFKMKWRQIGNGKVQLRVAIATCNSRVFICRGYVKHSDAVDKREAAKLKTHINQIALGKFSVRGDL